MQGSVKLQSYSKGQKTALLFGAGYCALHLAPQLQAAGYRLYATVRDSKKNAFLRRGGIEPIKFSGEMNDTLRSVMKRAEIILSSIPPMRDGTDSVISALRDKPKKLAPKLKWAGYLSATSVYGDRSGQWAFEDEVLKPSTKRGHARVEAELAWLETGWPVHVFRLAGIYGPKIGPKSKNSRTGVTRNPLERLKGGKARAVIKPGHIVNRIHVADICAALMSSIENPNPARVYNIADGNPAAPQEVLNFGARLLGLPLPPEVDVADPSVSDMARSFYKDNKRVDISRARTELGFVPVFYSFRQGLLNLAQAEYPKRVYLGGHIIVPERARAAVAEALPEHIRLTRQEAGCLRFDVERDPQDETKFHVVEIFKSPAAFAKHQARAGMSAWAAASEGCPRDYVVSGNVIAD